MSSEYFTEDDKVHPGDIVPEENLSADSLEKVTLEEELGQVPRAEPKEPKDDDVAPDGGYGWVVVACTFLINGHTWGINSSYGVFLAHYLATDTYPGATFLQYAFVGGLSISMCPLVSPIATIAVRKYGTRITLAIGVALQTGGLLGASWSNQIWHLFLSQGLLFGLGMGFLFVGSVGLVPQWFDKRRSFANSIGTAGSGIGGLVYSLASSAMIQSIGLGWAFRILAIITLVVNGSCTILIRDRNKAIGSIYKAFSSELLKRPEFLLLLGWGFFSMLGYVVLLFSVADYGRSIQLTAQQGSVISALLNLGQGLGRPFVGYFSDAAGRINMALLGTLFSGLFCLLIWIFAKTYGIMIFFALITGATAGTYWTTIAPVSAEVVGMRILPSALSIVWVSLILPSLFAEPIGLQLKPSTGNIYLNTQVFTGCMYIGAAICMWFLRAWKISELRAMEKANAEREAGTKVVEHLSAQEPVAIRAVGVAASMASFAKGLWVWQRV
jgi:MFS family permease